MHPGKTLIALCCLTSALGCVVPLGYGRPRFCDARQDGAAGTPDLGDRAMATGGSLGGGDAAWPGPDGTVGKR